MNRREGGDKRWAPPSSLIHRVHPPFSVCDALLPHQLQCMLTHSMCDCVCGGQCCQIFLFGLPSRLEKDTDGLRKICRPKRIHYHLINKCLALIGIYQCHLAALMKGAARWAGKEEPPQSDTSRRDHKKTPVYPLFPPIGRRRRHTYLSSVEKDLLLASQFCLFC